MLTKYRIRLLSTAVLVPMQISTKVELLILWKKTNISLEQKCWKLKISLQTDAIWDKSFDISTFKIGQVKEGTALKNLFTYYTQGYSIFIS